MEKEGRIDEGRWMEERGGMIDGGMIEHIGGGRIEIVFY